MSRTIEDPVTILSTSAADVAEEDAVYYDIDGPDQVIFTIDLTGTGTITIDFDINGDGSVIVQEAFTADDQKVLDDPAGRVKAFTSGLSAEEAATVKMRRIYFN